jgi:PhoPQ-activated pathogenicity-related protein
MAAPSPPGSLLPAVSTPTALDTYVAAPDSSYKYSLKSTLTGPGYTDYVIDLTSQTWRSPTEVDRTVWKHWLQIIVPATLKTTTAVLFIAGGSNSSTPPTTANQFGVTTATTLGAIATVLPTVPNEPLTFAGETSPRSEDQIIAYTFNQFLNGGDANWPLLLPMVKSAVRAMDTTQAVITAQYNGSIQVNNFIVTGASKRGWTTWLTPAVDSRVRAIVPYVFDVLNAGVQLPHHKDTYVGVTQDIVGGYSNAIQDYTNFHVFDRLSTPQGQALQRIVDPYQYLGRPTYNIPKYLVVSTGDQFFVSDSAQFYFSNLPGKNYIRSVPNTGHGLNDDADTGAINFEKALLDGATLPSFSWNVTDGGTTIAMTTIDSPIAVNMWQATNPNNRDFRVETFGPNWTSSPLADQGGGHYIAHVNIPPTGATAFFIEMKYLVDGVQLTFTTQVSKVPLFVPKLVAVDAGGTYNGSPFPASAAATALAGGPVSGNFTFTYYVGSTPTGSGSSTPPTNAGTYTVVAAFASANPTYADAQSPPITFSIKPAAPIVAVTDVGGPYNGKPFAASATATGIDGASVSGNFSFTYYEGRTPGSNGFSDAPINAGIYTVVASFISSDSNYTNAQSSPVTFSITSNDAPLTASAVNITAQPGVAFTGLVARFKDGDPHGSIGDYTASIDWGDGNTSTGTISVDKAGGFDVVGGNTYAIDGTFTVVVTIIDQAGGVGNHTIVQTTAVVVGVPLTSVGQALTATEGISTGAVIPVVVSAANPTAVATDFTGTIDWGDGTPASPATFVDNGNGTFQVVGTHTFAEEGVYAVTAQVTDLDGNQTSAVGSFTVGDAPLVLTPLKVALSARGTALNVLVATFQDLGGVDPATTYGAQISWGDNTPPTAGTVTLANGTYRLTGSHIYTVLGNFPVTVTVTDDGGSTQQANTTTINRSLNERFVTLLYLDLLERIVDDATLATVGNQLDSGSQTRSQVAQTLINSSEYRTLVVGSLYQQILGRTVDQTGLQNALNFLAGGGSAEGLKTLLFGSTEYFNRQGGTVDGFLTGLFQDVLNRPIDPAAKQALEMAISHGMSRTAVAAEVLGSPESDMLEVNNLFLEILHRPVDSMSLPGFVGALQKGMTNEQLMVLLTGSPEYAQASGGDANQVFIIQLFRDVLLRDVDASSLAFFTTALDSGSLTRQQVVTLVISSPEYRVLQVQQAFERYLHRLADPVSLSNFSAFLAQGGTVEQMDATLAGSPEYFNNRAGGTRDGFVNAIFFDVLGRPVDAATRLLYVQALASGVTTGQIATALLSSVEYAQKLVDGLYQHFLPPPADNSGRTALFNAFRNGSRDEDLIAILVESAEYFKRL